MKMKKMLLMVISIFFINCNNSKIKVVEIKGVGFSNGDTVLSTYKYYPTNFKNIFKVDRFFRSVKDTSFTISDLYYLKVTSDTVFLGLEIDKEIYFLPYLLRKSSITNVFDFNSFNKSEGVMLGVSGKLRKLKSEQKRKESIEYYKGIDFGGIFLDTVLLGFTDGYVINSIKNKDFYFSFQKSYFINGKIEKINVNKLHSRE